MIPEAGPAERYFAQYAPDWPFLGIAPMCGFNAGAGIRTVSCVETGGTAPPEIT